MFEKFEGFGHSVGLGDNIALIVIDFINGFTNPASALGSDYTEEIGHTKKLLTISREKGIPVLFTTISYESHLEDAGNFIKKVPALEILTEGSEWVEVDSRLERKETEPLIVKKFASSFFGTTLASILAAKKIDTIILAGATTSGCIRATAVDGLQYGYHVIVPEECVGDRSEKAHHANLYDIDTKYGDVMKLEKVVQLMEEK